MDAALRIVDESPAGAILHELILRVPAPRITLRALIEQRVREEVARWNAGGERPRLFEPTGAEAELNAPPRRRVVVADTHTARALAAFEAGRILVLADARQITSLDDEIAIGPDTVVSFIKLMPLVGG
jgi:hypothetical protein